MVHQRQSLQDSMEQPISTLPPNSVEQGISTQQPNSQQNSLSYRQKRRIEQAERQSGRKTRGPSRGVKWQAKRDNRLGDIPSCSITSEMKRIVGENAIQFVTEASNLVRTMLPLNCSGWRSMDADTKQRLINKIKGSWKFLSTENIDRIVEKQCQEIYRDWRYTLKERHFRGYTIAQAIKNRPGNIDRDQWKWIVEKYWGTAKVQRISEQNRDARLKQKVKGNQGSTSTARILKMLRKFQGGNSSQSSEQATQNSEGGTHGSQETVVGSNEVQPPPEPEYIRLWEFTKRHKDNSWDEVAAQRLEDFKALHKQQVELYGVDNLTVQEAYLRVLGTSSGYVNGLGFGPKLPKHSREDRSGEDIDIAHQMAQQMEQMERNSREREAAIKAQVEKESREREAQLQGEIEKLKQEAEDYKSKMTADFQALQDKVAAFFAANPQR